MAKTSPISAMQQAILGRKIMIETHQSSGVFNGMEEIITDVNKKFPIQGKPIVVRRDLAKYQGSLSQVVYMLGKLTGEPVIGDDTLKGNEKKLDQYSQTIAVKQARQAIATAGVEDEVSGAVQLFPLFKDALVDYFRDWKAKEYVRKLAGATSKTFSNTPTASTTDRTLYGGDATSTATIEAADTLDPTLVKKAVTMARNEALTGTDGNTIPPLGRINFGKVKCGLILAHPDAYDDLLTNSNMQQILRETAAFQKDNPLINAGDILIYDTIIRACEYLRETDVGEFSTWGSGGALPGAISLFLGAGALAVSECKAPKYTPDTDDYENIKGVAYGSIFGMQKALFNGQDLGMIAIKTYRAGL